MHHRSHLFVSSLSFRHFPPRGKKDTLSGRYISLQLRVSIKRRGQRRTPARTSPDGDSGVRASSRDSRVDKNRSVLCGARPPPPRLDFRARLCSARAAETRFLVAEDLIHGDGASTPFSLSLPPFRPARPRRAIVRRLRARATRSKGKSIYRVAICI